MDVLEIVRSENQRIKDLFSQLKTESGKQQRKLLFENIRHDIDLHFYAEQNVLYPSLKKYPECELILKDLEANHVDIGNLVQKLRTAESTSIDFENRVVELINHFDDHVAREEGELFPTVRKIMRRPEREAIGRHFKAVEQEREEAA